MARCFNITEDEGEGKDKKEFSGPAGTDSEISLSLFAFKATAVRRELTSSELLKSLGLAA
jgi:hypothetical protein